MIKHFKVLSVALVTTSLFMASLMITAHAKDESIGSLRGVHGLNEPSENPKTAAIILPDEGILPRDIPYQPPLIPHETVKTRISLRENQCLGCHGKLEFKDIGATEIGKNHYINRAGEELGSISTRYYFCTQCHAAQEDLDPLIENKFQSIVKDQIKVKDSRKKLDQAMGRTGSAEAPKTTEASKTAEVPKAAEAPKAEATKTDK